MKRKDISSHRDACTHESINCPYKKIGCRVSLARRDLDDHMRSKTQDHMMKLMESHVAMRSKMQDIGEMVRGMENELKKKEGSNSMIMTLTCVNTILMEETELKMDGSVTLGVNTHTQNKKLNL